MEYTSRLYGIAASLGSYEGRIYVPGSDKEIERGDILVAEMTMSDMLEQILKASAIVTEQGGMLSHSAVISRELRIPCIVGVADATKLLHYGDIVKVNANSMKEAYIMYNART